MEVGLNNALQLSAKRACCLPTTLECLCAHTTRPFSSPAALLVVTLRLFVCPLLETACKGHGDEESAEGTPGTVGVHVAGQCGLLGEGVGAQVAAKGVLARVDAQVGIHMDLLHEGLAQ